jgi:signal transduction histidine kinase
LTTLKRPDPVIFVVAALLGAAALVVYLQHRALRALDHQATLFMQKVAQQALGEVSAEIRVTFDGPVFDVLTAVNHPHLVANRLDLVEREYCRGLDAYPQVERFFVWRGTEESADASEVLFYSRRASGSPNGESRRFEPDPAMGQAVLASARRHARSQRIYALTGHSVGGAPYEIFVRIFYTDATRERFFAVLGFAVSLETVRASLFQQLEAGRLRPLLHPQDGTPQFEMAVVDESGRSLFGPPVPHPGVSASAPLAVRFYPEADIRSRMTSEVPGRTWTLHVIPHDPQAPALLASTRMQSYWLSGLPVLLILMALAFALQVRQRAAQLARMQADFVAHVSHQLKTPVSLLSAVGETMALDRVRSSEKLAHCVEVVRIETARLSSLVERILEFSRVSNGAKRLELEAVPVGPLVRETVESFSTALKDSGFTIEVEEVGPAPVVAADPVALEQALVNLLDNAVKYSGDARLVTVRLTTAGADAVIEVVDRGIGIDPADRKRIFERFYRGAGASLHRHGFGLGLPIVRELVTGQRGTIDVRSTPGSGSTFRIRIPILTQGAGATARIPARQHPVRAGRRARRPALPGRTSPDAGQ